MTTRDADFLLPCGARILRSGGSWSVSTAGAGAGAEVGVVPAPLDFLGDSDVAAIVSGASPVFARGGSVVVPVKSAGRCFFWSGGGWGVARVRWDHALPCWPLVAFLKGGGMTVARADDGVVLEPRDVEVFGPDAGGRTEPVVSGLQGGKALVVWGEEAALLEAARGEGEESWHVKRV